MYGNKIVYKETSGRAINDADFRLHKKSAKKEKHIVSIQSIEKKII